KGYTDSIRILLSREHIDVNSKDLTTGQTPLMLFARDGDISFLERTIDLGASLDEVDLTEKTALMYACMPRHQCDSVEELLDAGANVNINDQNGRNALMFTCKSGCYNCAKMILAGRAEVNACTRQGQTAMTYALTSCIIRSCFASFSITEHLVKLLLLKGATLDLCKFTKEIVSDIKCYYRMYDTIIFLYRMLLQYSCKPCRFRLIGEIRAMVNNNITSIHEFSIITKIKATEIASILQNAADGDSDSESDDETDEDSDSDHDSDNENVNRNRIDKGLNTMDFAYSTAFKKLLEQYPKDLRLEHIAAMSTREAHGVEYVKSLVDCGEFPKPIYDIFEKIVTPQ
ncbi:unnamed protein product, partial [Owenia fusiformis]